MDIRPNAGRIVILPFFLALLALVAGRAAGAINWTNRSGGNWSQPLNWDPHRVPGPADDALITAPGTYTVTVDAPAEAGSLVMASASGAQRLTIAAAGKLTLNYPSILSNNASLRLLGTLAGDSDVVLRGPTNSWESGSMTGAGTTLVSTGAVLLLSTTNNHDLVARTLATQGPVQWNGGRLRMGSGAVITNSQTWTIALSDTNSLSGELGGEAHLRNSGTFALNSGGLDIAVPSEASGTFSVRSNSVLQFLASHQFQGATLAGPGLTRWKGRLFVGSGTLRADRLELAAGTLGGDWTLAGRLDWVGGDMSGRGQLTIAEGSTLNISGAAVDHDLPQHSLLNQGTVQHSGGRVRGGAGTSIVNVGSWIDSADAGFTQDFGGAASVFDNQGVLRKSGGVGSMTFQTSFQFRNSGTTQVDKGSLWLAGGGQSSGLFTAATNAAVVFNAGFDCLSGNRLEGTGVFRMLSGQILLQGSYDSAVISLEGASLAGTNAFNGRIDWLSGRFSGPGATVFGPAARVNLSGPGPHEIPAHTVVNLGTMLWTEGTFRHGQGSVMDNRGTLQIKAASGDLSLDGDLGGASWLANSGVIDLQKGNLAQNLPGLGSGTFRVATNLVMTFTSGHRFDSGAAFRGRGTVRLNNAFYQFDGAITSENLEWNNGVYSGFASLSGSVNWLSGTLDALLSLTLQPGATLLVASANGHDIAGATLVNQGTLQWTGGNIRTGNGTWIDNQGLILAQLPGELGINSDYGGPSTLQNRGEFRVEKGIADLAVGGDTSGRFVVSAAGTLNILADQRFRDGARLLGPGMTLLAGGAHALEGSLLGENLRLKSGMISGNGTFSGNIDWAGSSLEGPGTFTLSSGSTLTISTSGNHDLPGRTLVNLGTVTHQAGNLRTGNGTQILSQGTWVEQSPAVFGFDYGGAYSLFDNTGTLRKTATSGATTFSTGVALRNGGTVLLEGGTLALSEPYVQRAGVTRLANATLASTPTVQIQAGSLEGTGTLAAPLRLAGTCTPGLPTGLLTITGNLLLTRSAQLNCLLADEPATKGFGRLQVGGTCTTAGTLGVVLNAGYVPSAGAAYPLITSGGLSGGFDTFTYPTAQTTLATTNAGGVFSVLVTKGGVSAPRITSISLSANGTALSWSSTVAQKYHLQYRTNLDLGTWVDLGTDITAPATTTSGLDPAKPTLARRFYRVRLAP